MENEKVEATSSKEGMLAMMDEGTDQNVPTNGVLTLKDVERLKMLATSTDEGNKNLLFAYLDAVTYAGNEIALLTFFKKCQHYISTTDFEKNSPKFVAWLSSFKIDNFSKNKIISYDDITRIYQDPKTKFNTPENLEFYMAGFAEWAEELTLLTIPESKQENVDVTIKITKASPVPFVIPPIPSYPPNKTLDKNDVKDLITISKYIKSDSEFDDFVKNLEKYTLHSGNEIAFGVIHKHLAQINSEELTRENSSFKPYVLDQKRFEAAAPKVHKKLLDMNIENYNKSSLFVFRDLIYHFEKQTKSDKHWELIKEFYGKYIAHIVRKNFSLCDIEVSVVIS